jgi:uncharacterized pyridoxal phosphate-containing UPF0001 family protein
VPVLVEVNVSGEEGKFGVSPDGLPGLLVAVGRFEHLRGEGLMTMAPFSPDPERARPVFRRLRELAGRFTDGPRLRMRHLSMGMTQDYEVAVEEGATIVRVGTAIFR